MRRLWVLVSMCAIAASGCAKQVDIDAERAALRAADAEWAQTIAAKDATAFTGFFVDDATLMSPNMAVIEGTAGIHEWAEQNMALPGFSVVWQATGVDVAASGDLGYTMGTFDFQITLPDGTPIKDRGKYTTLWRKQTDGSWKVVVDIFNSDIPMAPQAAAADTTTGTH